MFPTDSIVRLSDGVASEDPNVSSRAVGFASAHRHAIQRREKRLDVPRPVLDPCRQRGRQQDIQLQRAEAEEPILAAS